MARTPAVPEARSQPAPPVLPTQQAGSVFADVLAALGELDVAQEELRVADEALKEYEDQLAAVVERHQEEQRWRERVSSLVPVCQFVTDLRGTVQEADGATARMLATPVERLSGKPLAVFVAADRRGPLRAALSSLSSGQAEARVVLPVQPRAGESTVVDAVGVLEGTGSGDRVRWVWLPAALRGGPTADGDDDRDLAVAAAVARLCVVPVGEEDRQAVLAQLSGIVRDAVGAADSASITVGSPADPQQLASDSRSAQELDGLTYRIGEGPCLAAYESGQTVATGDLLADDRFPRLAAAAGGTGVRSVLSLPVVAGEATLGVLNVYAAQVDAFGERDRRVGELVASVVAAVLEQVSQRQSLRSLTEHLRQALTSRAVIEQAKGIVMAHHGGTADEAFARLVALSNTHNVKLRDLAGLIVEGGARQGLGPWMSGS
ncbi:GAF domain-containing protein [Modestobacter sp. Leaf380]|uniref:ANTAR domain-containing protein n=1 Tax=Modestobacter sp. Leaf380 TaxID=1736356 RepID=UPI0006F68AC1|nr:GAF domain-containing protein [Modestobacter sp. Leaf380]KQS66088.1 hypothetical protein ASG41_12025 [Modestobacter sp. Leaf380]